MAKTERIALMKEIGDKRGSNVISYVTGDRRNLEAPIAPDVIRLVYDHLLRLPDKDHLDFFVYSTGGFVDVPWKVVPMLREFCKELGVLIPYKAYSATTLIAIGADEILMGKKAELGPVDPSLKNPFHPEDPYSKQKQPLEIGVEDITAFINFFRDELNIKNKKQIAEFFKLLTDKIGPLALGRLNRTLLHNRLLIKKLIKSRKNPPEKKKIKEIANNLTERIFFHGHAINRREAKEDIGLNNITFPNKEIEDLIWQLFLEYEKELLLNEPFEPEVLLEARGEDEACETGLKIAYIESPNLTHVCEMDMKIKRVRQFPVNLNLNVNIGLPPGIDPRNIPQSVMQAIHSQLQQSVIAQINQQSKIEGIIARRTSGGWKIET